MALWCQTHSVGWRHPLGACLLIGMSSRKHRAVGPFRSYEGKAHWETLDSAHRHCEVRIAGDRGKVAHARACIMVAVHEVAGPGGTVGHADEQVDAVILQQLVDPLRTGEPSGLCLGGKIGGTIEAAPGLGEFE